MVDLHCHILPGLDDGSPDLETSLEMAQVAVGDGIDTIVATPHVASGSPLSPAQIRTATQAMNVVLREHDIHLVVLPGAEVEAQTRLPELVRGGQVVTLGDKGRHLLIEIPLVGIPQLLEQMCFELQLVGITPVLAHPERTELGSRKREILETLVQRGCILQANVDSVLGHNGRRIRRLTLDLLRSGLVQVLSSDAHDPHYRPPELSGARKELARSLKNIDFDMLVEELPRSIIEGPREDDA